MIEAIIQIIVSEFEEKKIFCSDIPNRILIHDLTYFPISIDDYRSIKNYIHKVGNDYEILYFDLFTLNRNFITSPCPEVNEVSFQNRHAIINLIDQKVICPTDISKQITKIINSRNLIENEPLFASMARIRGDFRLKIKKFCLSSNIPMYAQKSIASLFLRFCQKNDITSNNPSFAEHAYNKFLLKSDDLFTYIPFSNIENF